MQQQDINQLPVLAVPKGRLGDIFNPLITQAGFEIKRQRRQDFGVVYDETSDTPGTALALTVYESYDDMSSSFENGEIDAGIMGRDTLIEIQSRAMLARKSAPLKITQRFKNVTQMRCKLVIAAADQIRAAKDLKGAIFATKYPKTVQRWLDERKIEGCEMRYRSGALEDIMRRQTADAICDISQSGSTLAAYELKTCFKISDIYPVWVEPTNDQKRSTRATAFLDNIKRRIWEVVNEPAPALANA